jgi:hypothetical protein
MHPRIKSYLVSSKIESSVKKLDEKNLVARYTYRRRNTYYSILYDFDELVDKIANHYARRELKKMKKEFAKRNFEKIVERKAKKLLSEEMNSQE